MESVHHDVVLNLFKILVHVISLDENDVNKHIFSLEIVTICLLYTWNLLQNIKYT